MWNLIAHFLNFTCGMSAGVVLMCILQAGKRADEEFEQMQRRNRVNEHGCDEVTILTYGAVWKTGSVYKFADGCEYSAAGLLLL